jgi:GT2 family glycosyltransferase
MTPKSPCVFIILVNWNGLSDTRECLESLSKITYPNARVVVVDNGSQNGDANNLRLSFPNVETLETGANLGFTGGNNVGIQYALSQDAQYLLCLNNDTIVESGFLEPLVQALEDSPEAGLASSEIFYFDDPQRHWYLGAAVSFAGEMAHEGAPAWHLEPSEALRQVQKPFVTDVATGCSLLARADVLKQLGGYDDRYFAYYEDVDLNLRAKKLGFQSLVVPASRLWHKVSRASGGAASPNVLYFSLRNARLLAQTHRQGGGWSAERFYLNFLRCTLLVTLSRPGSSRKELNTKVLTVFLASHDAYRRRYGRRHRNLKAEAILGALLAPMLPGLIFAARLHWWLKARLVKPLRAFSHAVSRHARVS